jgi:putative transposase
VIVEFIDQHRDVFGVEPICGVLSEHGCAIAPSTYYAARRRPLAARRQRDLTWSGRRDSNPRPSPWQR